MNRTTIGLVWLGGIVLMLVLYAAGPLHFLAAFENFLLNIWDALDRLSALLAYKALDVVRAAAIALYVVFLVLAAVARRHGLRTDGLLVTLSLAFLILVGTDWYAPGTRWTAAAVLAGAGALVMTSRLLRPPPPPRMRSRRPGQPWPTGEFSPDGEARR